MDDLGDLWRLNKQFWHLLDHLETVSEEKRKLARAFRRRFSEIEKIPPEERQAKLAALVQEVQGAF